MSPNVLLGKRILVVTAHPDDESYLAAGTVHANRNAGGETVLVCGTRGEKGTSHLKKPLPAAQFKRLRSAELKNACRVIGVKRLCLMDFPDGSLHDHEREYFRKALKIAEKTHPEAMVSFGPDGLTGHRDHIAAGKVARHLARHLGIPFFAAALPPRLRRLSVKWIMSRWRAPHYRKSALNHGRHSMRIPIDGRVKRRAVSCHRSQMDGPEVMSGFPKYVVREFLRAEYFAVDS